MADLAVVEGAGGGDELVTGFVGEIVEQAAGAQRHVGVEGLRVGHAQDAGRTVGAAARAGRFVLVGDDDLATALGEAAGGRRTDQAGSDDDVLGGIHAGPPCW